MKLEIIPNPSDPTTLGGKDAASAPILLVHGAWHSAVCWREFADYLRQQGRVCYAVSLRGHGASENDRPLRLTRLDAYVTDLRQAVAEISAAHGQKPVLVGHSMGGHVVQKYLERDHDIPHAVLLASSPVQGVWRITLRLFWRHPLVFLNANLTWRLWPFVGTPALAREALFSEDIAQEELQRYFSELQDESYMAFLDMLVFRLPRPKRVKTPVMVLGGGKDTIFSVAEAQATARAYGTTAKIYHNMAHNLMQERGWQTVADDILATVQNKIGQN